MQESFFDRLISILSNVMDNILIQRQDVFDVFFSMFLAIAIALVISQIYKHTHRGMNFELSFMSTLVLLAPIVSVVMLFIRGDLVLSLGLIGSLSIIRFRTPIKDTRDMVFLFWTIAVGLGCGTYNWAIVIISTIFISIVIVSLYFLKYGRSESTDYILVVSGSTPSDNTSLEKIIHEYVEEVKMRSFEKSGQQWESIYELGFPKSKKMVVKNMINSIESLPEVSRVSLLAPQLALPV
jgi:hypothetical protein